MNKPTVWILGDQLRLSISALAELAPGACRVLMIESVTRSHELPFHKKKIAFVWSAMRHFADELRHLGYDVDYHTASPSYASALALHIKHCRPNEVRIMETSEHGRAAILAKRVEAAGVQAILTPNNSFLSDEADFGRWARGKKRLLLETFYRSMRRKTGILMEGDEPVGGSWNYDRENRKTPPPDHLFPRAPRYEPDRVTQDVIVTVDQLTEAHFGTLDGFALPVTRAQATDSAQNFFENRLDLFGPYQDAIVAGRQELYHSGLSLLLNVGLLDPLELCREAEARYQAGHASPISPASISSALLTRSAASTIGMSSTAIE